MSVYVLYLLLILSVVNVCMCGLCKYVVEFHFNLLDLGLVMRKRKVKQPRYTRVLPLYVFLKKDIA